MDTGGYLTKYQAIAYIGMQTRFGRRIIENMMEKLAAAGEITFTKGLDNRSLLISSVDVQKVIDALRQYPA